MIEPSTCFAYSEPDRDGDLTARVVIEYVDGRRVHLKVTRHRGEAGPAGDTFSATVSLDGDGTETIMRCDTWDGLVAAVSAWADSVAP